ncbi:hypothetical protein GGI19_000632 [Coemansia pectinata]|uniref:C2H2-type domain-containing protein n=1 Tax=Coemansia pectinata TaxID=1052879 RepID=A0A9W8GZ17_9FUNG|nr:hypothetical protein GGI19_000632 [Coemansia pectinata]
MYAKGHKPAAKAEGRGYLCDHPGCKKFFLKKGNLDSYRRTHTGERPHGCGQCEQRFSRNHDLKRHVKIHSGERPFICSICLRTFARSDALVRHTSNVTACKWAGSALVSINNFY